MNIKTNFGKLFEVIWPKKVAFAWQIGPEFIQSLKENKDFDPKHKIPNNQWEKLNRFYYCEFQKFDF